MLSAIVKYHCTTAASAPLLTRWILPAGKAYAGRRQLLARAYQGAPIAITVEGANDLTRSMMIFGRGRFAAIRTYWRRWPPRRIMT